MEAEKLKKKLHGSILKGKKMRVEDARPPAPAIILESPVENQSEIQERAAAKKSKKRKEENGVLPGFELPDRRHVKRGWTDHTVKETRSKRRKKDEDKAQPSKYTQKDELLFRTEVPDNKMLPESKTSKGKRGKGQKQTVVHEFSNTTKHASFLRSSGGDSKKKITKRYDDEKGWVDEDGTINEPKRESTAKQASRKAPEEDGNDVTSSSGEDAASGSEETSSNEDSAKETREVTRRDSNGDTESSDESSSGGDNIDAGIGITVEAAPEATTSTSDTKEQLEALFKRPKSKRTAKPSLEVNTAFTFFDPDNEDGKPLHTPFTLVDRRERNLRSAAPTPDTPAPGTTTFSARQLRTRLRDQSLNSYGEHGDSSSAKNSTQKETPPLDKDGKPEESEFSKWFWEHRGETNREWKRRRREAAKEERHRENRKKSGR
jgi:hypothetical protein